jgi:hypothetical protein
MGSVGVAGHCHFYNKGQQPGKLPGFSTSNIFWFLSWWLVQPIFTSVFRLAVCEQPKRNQHNAGE